MTPIMGRPNPGFEKRQRERKKAEKRKEKERRKAERQAQKLGGDVSDTENPDAPPADETTTPAGDQVPPAGETAPPPGETVSDESRDPNPSS